MTIRSVARAGGALLAAAAALVGCAVPPDHFHTLRAATPVPVPASLTADRILAIGPVTVPEALQRDAWVIRTGPTGAQVHEHQLWSQGLAAEVAQSLADALNRGPLPDALWADAGPTGSGAGTDLDVPAVLRVRVQVVRFDATFTPAPAISDEVRWTLQCLPSDSSLAPIDAGRYLDVRGGVRDVAAPAPDPDPAVDDAQQRYDRLARAHVDALRQVAADIDRALRDSTADRARTCARAPR